MSLGTSGELQSPGSKIIGNMSVIFLFSQTEYIQLYFGPRDPQLTTGPRTHTWLPKIADAKWILGYQ